MILVLNAGSSSLRCALFRPGASEPAWRAHVADIGRDPTLSVAGVVVTGEGPPADDHAAVARWLFARLPVTPTAAGHRVVHGGLRHAAPVRLNVDVMAALEELVPLAPAHQPQALACIRAVGETWPDLPQVACFDTAFHRTQDRLAQLTRCRAHSSTRGSCASASMGSPTPTLPSSSRTVGCWRRILAMGRACAPSGTGGASPRRWVSPRSTG